MCSIAAKSEQNPMNKTWRHILILTAVMLGLGAMLRLSICLIWEAISIRLKQKL